MDGGIHHAALHGTAQVAHGVQVGPAGDATVEHRRAGLSELADEDAGELLGVDLDQVGGHGDRRRGSGHGRAGQRHGDAVAVGLLHDERRGRAELERTDGKRGGDGDKGFFNELLTAAGHHGGQVQHLVKTLDVVHSGHDVLAGSLHAGVNHVHVIRISRNVGGNAGPQEEMDVVEFVHQARQKIKILQGGRAVFAGFKIDDADGRSARAQVDPILGQVQVVPAGAAVKHDPARGLADMLQHDVAREADPGRGPVYCHSGAFQKPQHIVEAGFVSEAGLLQDAEGGLMDGLNILSGKRLVLAALQTL